MIKQESVDLGKIIVIIEKNEEMEERLKGRVNDETRYLNDKINQLEQAMIMNFTQMVQICRMMLEIMNQNTKTTDEFFQMIQPLLHDYKRYQDNRLEEVFGIAESQQKKLM